MRDIITDLTPRLEGKGLRLIYAAESGSRAWGFHSPDSDFDVRFIFAKTRKAYLSLHEGVQDIQYMKSIDGRDCDFAGWDLRKALLLAEKSNPSLIEWLGSPIIYADPVGFRSALEGIMVEHFSPRALAHHYVNFMRNIRGKYMADFLGEYTMKRYFYALRPILCVMWMRENPMRLPPVVFSDLLSLPVSNEVLEAMTELMKLKRDAAKAQDYKSSQLDDFIKGWYEKGHDIANSFPSHDMPKGILDNLFLKTIGEPL